MNNKKVNKIDLQARMLVQTALCNMMNNDWTLKQTSRGGLMALNSPAFADIRKETNPLRPPTDPVKVSWTQGAMPYPKFEHTYNPSSKRAVQTTRSSIATDTKVQPVLGAKQTVQYDTYIEPVAAVEQNLMQSLNAESVEQFYKLWSGGKMTIATVMEQFSAVSSVAHDVYTRGVKDLIPAYEDTIMAKLFLSVGKNPAYPAVVFPTASSPIVGFTGFNSVNGELTPHSDTYYGLLNIKDKCKMAGKPVLIGGQKWLEWHRKRNLFDFSMVTGINYGSMYSQVPWTFFYFENADTVFGQDVALFIEPNTVAHQNFTYLDSSPFLTGNNVVENVTFTKAQFSLSQYIPEQGAGFNELDPVFNMSMDMRILSKLTSTDFPVTSFKPSVSGGLFTRNLGYLTTESGDIFKDYTGIVAVKIN